MNLREASWPEDRDTLVRYLYSLSNEKYRDFSKSLIPGKFEMIGVNIPTLKKLAKEVYAGDYEKFCKMDAKGIFELKFLQGQVIANVKEPNEYLRLFKSYLPQVTDWSLCDSFIAASKVIKKEPVQFFALAKSLITEKSEFSNRIGFVILLNYFVDEEHYDEIIDTIKDYKENGMYYAEMALAWLLSVMYVKFPERTYTFLETKPVSVEVIKMTIRKIRDSYRVSKEDKEKIKKIA